MFFVRFTGRARDKLILRQPKIRRVMVREYMVRAGRNRSSQI